MKQPADKTMARLSLEGKTLGKYRILEPLGRGGMAEVYKAYHPGLDRYVAIKVLRADLSEDVEFLNRFRREARAIAALRHPNIVQIYDFDVQDDFYYMVMELLEGVPSKPT
jgi:serine/threonine protein kinase